jgi:uncharacterized damage-inducible protein DinB
MHNSITADFSTALGRDLTGFQSEIRLFPDDQTLWATRPGIANPVGNLALHVAGNIRHFIGNVLGGIPYTRDRDREFARRAGTRDELVGELAQALIAVEQVVPRLTAEQLDAIFTGHPDVRVPTRRFLLHLCTHTSFHLGQAGYLRRVINADARSTDTVNAARLG